MHKLLGRATVAVVALLVVLLGWSRFNSSELTERVNELERERAALSDYLRRLCTSRRVAQIDVLDRGVDASGEIVTRLSWQEIGANGVLARPRFIEVLGSLVYVEAMVIKFDYAHVAKGDADKDFTLAVFRRIFGDRQTPDSGPLLAPDQVLHEVSGEVDATAGDLFSRFWDLVDDPKLAKEHGVRVAQCEAAAVRLKPGEAWEVALDSSGGLNLRKVRDGGGALSEGRTAQGFAGQP